MTEHIDVMLCVPSPVTMDGTVLHGDVGDVVRGVHWAEAQAAERMGLVVALDDLQALAEVHASS